MNNGILVVTPTKIYDVAHSQEDEEYMEFELFVSRREYKMIRKHIERGRRQAVVEGNYIGTYRPYGYNIVKTKTKHCAKNAIDEPLGFDKGKYKKLPERLSHGIEIIGKKKKSS